MMLKKIARTMAYIGSIITGFYLFTSAPGFHKREKWQHLTGWDYAHRGLHDNEHGIPENSMAAFQRAVDKGYGIELDVHIDENVWNQQKDFGIFVFVSAAAPPFGDGGRHSSF